jgi:2-polyprenyl-3-methyl-5-hydroxy-6-metoxy-1,4-benzoquinol methylase
MQQKGDIPMNVALPPQERPAGLARAALLQKLGGYATTQLIYLFAKLGIADRLTPAGQSSGTLAAALRVPHDTLYRLLRGWISVGLLTENAAGEFVATPLGTLLATDRPDSLREYALLAGEVWYPAWQGLAHVVEDNRTPFEVVFGCDCYTYFAQKAEAGARFDRFMEMRTVQTAQALLDTYDFSAARVVVDVGGGNGILLQSLMCAHPHLQGILFEQPAVVCAAQQRPALAQLGERCQFVGSDFLCDVPPAGDHYILSQVLHNWSDEQCRQILRSCRQGLHPQGTLLLIEQVIPPQIQTNHPAVETDLMMLVLLKGRERTATEYEKLLHSAGFVVADIVPLKRLGFTLIKAKIQTGQRGV